MAICKTCGQAIKAGANLGRATSAGWKTTKAASKTNKADKAVASANRSMARVKSGKTAKVGLVGGRTARKAAKGAAVVGGAEVANKAQKYQRGITPKKSKQIKAWNRKTSKGQKAGRPPVGEREAARKRGKKYP